MTQFNLWLAVSETVITAKQELISARESVAPVDLETLARLSKEMLDEFQIGDEVRVGDGGRSTMREAAARELDAVADRMVEALYAKPTISGRRYTLQSIYVEDDGRPVEEHAKELMADYPGEVLLLGAWDVRTGKRLTDLHPDAWRLMPDVVTYDSEGNVTSTIPASSNADLRDINLLMGQSPRDFA